MQYLLPSIVTAIFAFIVGVLLWQFKKERVSLEYECGGSGTFPREKGIGRYFIVGIINSGNKPIQDVKFTITFPTGKIESVTYSDQNLVNNVGIEGSRLSGAIPLLNPKEALGLTLTLLGESDIGSPEIIARAVGVSAVEKKEKSIYIPPLNLLGPALGLMLTVVVFVGWMIYKQVVVSEKSLKTLESAENIDIVKLKKNLEKQREDQEREEKEQEQGKPETQQIVFAVLNRAGLGHLMFRLIETGEEITFWKTGLILTQEFLLNQEDRNKCINAMRSLSEMPNVSPSTIGFNLYLLGKMEQFRGNNDKAIEYFEKCRAKAPLMHDHLMAQDPSYNLKDLQNRMLSKSKR